MPVPTYIPKVPSVEVVCSAQEKEPQDNERAGSGRPDTCFPTPALFCQQHGDRVGSIVCSCGLVSVPFVTTVLLVRLSFIAWVRWMQYAVC